MKSSFKFFYKGALIGLQLCLFIVSHSFAFQALDNGSSEIERTWLFTDDYIYKAGDYVWFKVLTRSSESEQLSIVTYVSLVDKNGKHILQQRLIADKGAASGMLKLPDTLGTANYALLAYTRYGISKNPEYIASQLLKVKGKDDAQLSKTDRLPKLFFEGGKVVSGKNRVFMVSDGAALQAPVEAFLISENGKQKLSLEAGSRGYWVFDMMLDESFTSAYQLLIIQNGEEVLVKIPPIDNEGIALQLDLLDESELRFNLEGKLNGQPNIVTVSRNGIQVASKPIPNGTKQVTFDHNNWQEGKYKAEISSASGQLKSWRYFYLRSTKNRRKSTAGKFMPRQTLSVRGKFYSRTEDSHVLALVAPAAHSFHRMDRFISSNLLLQHLFLSFPDVDVNDALILERPADSATTEVVWKELNIFTHAFQSYLPDLPLALGLDDLVYDFWNEEETNWLIEKTRLTNLLAFYYPQQSYAPATLDADKIYWPAEYEQIYNVLDFFQHIVYEIKVSTLKDGAVNFALRYTHSGKNYTYKDEPMYIIDGYTVDKKAVLGMRLEQVESVSLISQQSSIDQAEIGPLSYNGIIFLQTTKGDYAKLHNLPVEQRLYKDLSLPYEFTNNPFKVRPDNLSSPYFHYPIHWEPNLSLLPDNKFNLEFRHTDSIGDFNIILIGVDQHNIVKTELIEYGTTF